jgi:hypothetical protein
MKPTRRRVQTASSAHINRNTVSTVDDSVSPAATSPYVLVRIYRPEGYEDVCDELVAEDALRGALGFDWELEEESAANKNSWRE